MGVNATTFVPTYVSGEVLTAADLNVTNSGIPVFADSTARDAAFGGTGEKVLAEGQYAFLESTNQTLVYDGASWIAVGASGLALVKSQVIGTTVGSVTVTDAFNSTYENYLITLNGGVASTSNVLQLTLGATSTGYYSNIVYMNYNSNSVNGQGVTNGSFFYGFLGSVNNLNGRVELFGPNLAKNTNINMQASRAVAAGETQRGEGYLADTTQYTAFTLTPNTGTITGGTIRVYGYANS